MLLSGAHRRELSGGYRRTTNNRMELLAALTGLRSLRYRCAVKLYTDSRYLVDSMMLGWAKRWQAKDWKVKGETRVNADLWKALLDECLRHDVEFLWVRGHANDLENQRCDELAVLAARGVDLPVDSGYEQSDDGSQGAFRL